MAPDRDLPILMAFDAYLLGILSGIVLTIVLMIGR